MSASEDNQPKRLWLIYFPRAAHHLFMRMFSDQLNLSTIEVLTHLDSTVEPTIQLSNNASLDHVRDECNDLRGRIYHGYESWLRNISELESQGKRVLNSSSVAFQLSPAVHSAVVQPTLRNGYHRDGDRKNPVKEYLSENISVPSSSPSDLSYWHLAGANNLKEDSTTWNPTPFPVSFLRSHQPILLIRHPALAFPSTIRVASEYFKNPVRETFMNLILRYRWHRIIHEWYIEHCQSEPIILDADDLMYSPTAVQELCRRTGLDFARIKYSWNRQVTDAMETTYANEKIFLDTLAESTGVVPGKGSDGVNTDEEADKWVEEFGSERAALLRQRVEAAMEDYLWLRERSLKATLQRSVAS